MRFSVDCAFPYLRKRGGVSRKGALWVGDVTERRTLWLRRGASSPGSKSPSPQTPPVPRLKAPTLGRRRLVTHT